MTAVFADWIVDMIDIHARYIENQAAVQAQLAWVNLRIFWCDVKIFWYS